MIFRRIILTASILFFSAAALSPALVSALDCTNPQTAQEQIQCGAKDASGNTGSKDANTTINDTIASIVNILSAVVGVIAVIMIIVAGLRYVASGGKQESVTSAKNTILYAVIGLVIVALAQLIVHFVIDKVNHAPAAQPPSASQKSSGGLSGSSTNPAPPSSLTGKSTPQ